MSLHNQMSVFEHSLLKFDNPVKIDNNSMTSVENDVTDNLVREEEEALREVFQAIKADRYVLIQSVNHSIATTILI